MLNEGRRNTSGLQQPHQEIRPATPPPTTEVARHSQTGVDLLERQHQLETRIEQYTRSLQEMQQQVANLEQQLLQMLQVQFTRLATDITTTLQLPQHQATLLQDLVAQHLDQLAVTAQLRPPRGVATQITHTPVYTRTPVPQQNTFHQSSRDPRLPQVRDHLTA